MTDTSLITELLGKSRTLLERGEYKEALPLLIQLIRMPGEHRAKAMSNLAVALYNLELYQAAKVYVLRALELDASLPAAHHNYGNILVALKDVDSALHFYDAAFRLQPSIDSFFLYAEVLFRLNQLDLLRQFLLEIFDFQFASSDQLHKLATLHMTLHNFKAAEPLLKEALAKEPNHFESLIAFSLLLFASNKVREALPYLQKVVRVFPNHSTGWAYLGIALLNLCKNDEAINCFEISYKLNSGSFLAFCNLFLFYPKLPADQEEIDFYYLRANNYLESISSHHALTISQSDPTYAHMFHFAYSNVNLKNVLASYSQAMSIALSNSDIDTSNRTRDTLTVRPSSNRTRIGFLSKFFNTHTNLLAFQGLIRNFDRSKFEVFLIHTHDSKIDEARSKIEMYVDRVITLSPVLIQAHSQLLELSLDFLFFTDIGMNGFETYLANMRSAPIQATGWGIPHTSGCTCIDYYVSSLLVEASDSDEHYSEKLVRLNSLPCCFLSEDLSFTALPKEFFFLPDHYVLIGCLQGLHKYHPDDDEIFETIAFQNPNALFVFVEDNSDAFTDAFLKRIKKSAPTMYERMHMLKQMSTAEFLSLCDNLDLLIDPLYYGSGITFYTASFTGVPIITLEGKYLRNRFVAAGYRHLGIKDAPIAETKEQIFYLARSLINSPDLRNKLKTEIKTKARMKLYNDLTYVSEFIKFVDSKV